ncbi:hypothetical protein IFM89_011787 [Coptis chinensis]|uniref:Uncharacterized protein n=1 Tax=Coptis chinensis TaxID=261450 RepID=A0A835H5A7_9MAGN|nr:hypothetical protein IFM89_011787 [Coptis chinensis]
MCGVSAGSLDHYQSLLDRNIFGHYGMSLTHQNYFSAKFRLAWFIGIHHFSAASLLYESFLLNDSVIILLPAAIFSLSVGCAPFPYLIKNLSIANSCFDFSEVVEGGIMAKGNQRFQYKLLECSVELLAEIEKGSDAKAMQSESQHIVVCHVGYQIPCEVEW